MYIKRTKSIFNLKPKGFTLIELLVVISIIGVLGSTIYAPFNEARKKGRDAKRVSIERQTTFRNQFGYSASSGPGN